MIVCDIEQDLILGIPYTPEEFAEKYGLTASLHKSKLYDGDDFAVIRTGSLADVRLGGCLFSGSFHFHKNKIWNIMLLPETKNKDCYPSKELLEEQLGVCQMVKAKVGDKIGIFELYIVQPFQKNEEGQYYINIRPDTDK